MYAGSREILRNVIDDVVNSQSVVAEKAFRMLWNGGDIIT